MTTKEAIIFHEYLRDKHMESVIWHSKKLELAKNRLKKQNEKRNQKQNANKA